MSTWILVPCLEALRAEVNRLAPGRDKTSDGTIGDTAHQGRTSDHNDDEIGNVPIRDADAEHEVHALDLDVNLNEPGLTMEDVVQHIVGRCRSGAEKRLRYVIYNRRIWEASNGWKQRVYTGDSPHTEHAHFSASYETSREADTSSWHLDELGDDMLVKKGDIGEQVKFWQYVLNDLGFALEIDGDYGDKTEAAINAWRKANGVTTTTTQITGWTGWSLLRAQAAKYAGKPGANGKDAVLGGTLTLSGGTLTVTGGNLEVSAS